MYDKQNLRAQGCALCGVYARSAFLEVLSDEP